MSALMDMAMQLFLNWGGTLILGSTALTCLILIIEDDMWMEWPVLILSVLLFIASIAR